MEPGAIVPIIVAILVLLGVVAAAGAVVYYILRLRSGERVTFPLRTLFHVYLYLMTLISIILMVFGLASLGRAGLGAALGKEFSYYPLYKAEPPRPAKPDGTIPEPTPEERETQKQLGLERALKEGILNGVSLTLVGAVAWGLHSWGRRRLETEEERHGVLNRGYLIVSLVIFGVITLVTLPSGLYDTLRYYILEPVDEFSQGAHPGTSLATALVSLPIWLYYLSATLRLVRRKETQNTTPG